MDFVSTDQHLVNVSRQHYLPTTLTKWVATLLCIHSYQSVWMLIITFQMFIICSHAITSFKQVLIALSGSCLFLDPNSINAPLLCLFDIL